jgi:hypothetical protein
MRPALKKVTVLLPEDLVSRAQRAHGEGLAPTIRRGLELVAAGRAYREIRRHRGKVRLSIDIAGLREDR